MIVELQQTELNIIACLLAQGTSFLRVLELMCLAMLAK